MRISSKTAELETSRSAKKPPCAKRCAFGRPRSRSIVKLFVLAGLLATINTARAVASPEIIERVVAIVNDEAIFLSQLRRRAAPFLEAVVAEVPPKRRKEHLKALYKKMLSQLVDDSLIEQTAKDLQLGVSSLEVDQAVGNVQRSNQMTEEDFWKAVGGQGFTKQQYRKDVRKQLLRLKVINQKVRARVNITEAQVREEYDTRLRQARRTQRFRAAHILFPLSESAAATDVADAMELAKKTRADLSPDKFLGQAEALGGGDLGWLDQGDLPASLENALLDLDPNQIGEPVRGPAGLHIFLLQERQAQEVTMPAFEASRTGIHQELLGKAMQRQEAIFLGELRKDAVVSTQL